MSKDSIAMDSARQLGVMGVLREAFNIPKINKKLMLPVILLSFLPSSLLQTGGYISIYPLLLDFIIKLYLLSQKDPNTPQFYDLLIGMKIDAGALMHVNMIAIVASYIISLFSMLLIIQASAMTYSGKQLTAKELLTRIKGVWKGLFVTRIYFTLFYIGYAIQSVWMISVLLLNASESIVLIAIGALLALMAHLLYVYLAMIWMVGMVISVIEEGCYGLKAVGKAGEFVKGRRLQGFLTALILVVIEGVLTGSYGLGIIKVQLHMAVKPATGLILINIIILLRLYSYMVYTVFYYECSHGKELEALEDIKYTRVPIASNIDVSLV